MKKKSKKKLQQIADEKSLLQKKQLLNPQLIIIEIERILNENISLSAIELSKKLNISPQRIISSLPTGKQLNSKLSKTETLYIMRLFRKDKLADIEKVPQKRIFNELIRNKKNPGISPHRPIYTPMRD